jgi:hypothetical protein
MFIKFLAIPRLPRHWAYFVVTTSSIYAALLWYQENSGDQLSLHQMPMVLLTNLVNGILLFLVDVAVLFGLGLFAARSSRRFFRAPLPFSTSRRAVEFGQRAARWMIGAAIFWLIYYFAVEILNQNYWTLNIGTLVLLQFPLYRTWVHLRRAHQWWRQRRSPTVGVAKIVAPLVLEAVQTSKKIWDYFFAERPSFN